MLYSIQTAITILIAVYSLITIIGLITALIHYKKKPKHAESMIFIATIFTISTAILAIILILMNIFNPKNMM